MPASLRLCVGNSRFQTSVRIVQYLQSIINNVCGFRVDRRLRPSDIRNAELSFCLAVEDPDGLNQVVVFDGPGYTRIRSKIVNPGAVVQ